MVGVKREHIGTHGGLSAVLALKQTLLLVALFLVVIVGGVMTLQVHADDIQPLEGQKVITLYDRGLEQSFVTDAATVGDALKGANIEIDTRDRVEPALDAPLVANEYKVNVYRARPLLIVDGMLRQVVMTASQVPDQIAKDAGITLHDEDITMLEQSDNLLADRAAERFVVTRATSFEFTLYGKTFTAYTQAKTVGDMLKEKKITLGEKDRASTGLSAEITEGMKLRIWREGKQTITTDEEIKFEVETIQDADREVGYRKVQTPGVKGERTVTYEVTIKDGKESGRKEISSVTKKKPQKQVEVVGAKFHYKGGPLTEAQITALGNCESGMTPTRNSGNGFYGAFQFMPSTWRAVAPGEYSNVMPHQAPLNAQKQAVQNLLSRSSIYTQFPGCAKKMTAQGIL